MKRTWITPASLSTLLICILLMAVLAKGDWNPLELAKIGTQYSIGDPQGTEGYDGQFNYYLAKNLSPQALEGQLDVPAYRYQRILLPVLAMMLSLGIEGWLPWVFPLISIVIHFFATRTLTQMLANWKVSRWYALAYSLWVGLTLAIRLDLAEALALGLIIFAIGAQLEGHQKRSWILYSLAVFAKETMLIFVAGQALAYLVKREWKPFLSLVAIAVLPFGLFQLWLTRNFGSLGLGLGGAGATPVEWFPFNGIWRISEYSWD